LLSMTFGFRPSVLLGGFSKIAGCPCCLSCAYAWERAIPSQSLLFAPEKCNLPKFRGFPLNVRPQSRFPPLSRARGPAKRLKTLGIPTPSFEEPHRRVPLYPFRPGISFAKPTAGSCMSFERIGWESPRGVLGLGNRGPWDRVGNGAAKQGRSSLGPGGKSLGKSWVPCGESGALPPKTQDRRPCYAQCCPPGADGQIVATRITRRPRGHCTPQTFSDRIHCWAYLSP